MAIGHDQEPKDERIAAANVNRYITWVRMPPYNPQTAFGDVGPDHQKAVGRWSSDIGPETLRVLQVSCDALDIPRLEPGAEVVVEGKHMERLIRAGADIPTGVSKRVDLTKRA